VIQVALSKRHLRNLVQVDNERLNAILDQLPTSLSIIEDLKLKFGFGLAQAKIEIQPSQFRDRSTIKRIRKLESYLGRNGLVNVARPRRMPHRLGSNAGYWWVKECFMARKVMIPTPKLFNQFGVMALTVWVSDPKRVSKPQNEWDWTGSFLYLPTVHYEDGKFNACISGCSALQYIVNAALDKPLLSRNPNEFFGRDNAAHPLDKLASLGAVVSDERRVESLYYVRYISDEQVYLRNSKKIRLNDVVGYPIYIASLPFSASSKGRLHSTRGSPITSKRAATDLGGWKSELVKLQNSKLT
jgi:hypothetical protein